MRNFIALAVGLVFFISAAAATGNGNYVNADLYSEAVDNCVTGGVTLAQITSSTADLIGNCNDVGQNQDLYANGNYLTDSMNGDTSVFVQMGTQEA